MSLAAGNMAGGGNDQLLALLNDPEAVKKRLAQLQEAERQAKEQIALAGTANEILTIRAEIDGLKEQAQEHEKHAREECERLISEAGTQAQSIVDKAQEEAGKTVADANSVAADAREVSAKAQSEVSAVEQGKVENRRRAQALDGRESEISQKADDLARREKELEEKKSRFAEAQALIAAI